MKQILKLCTASAVMMFGGLGVRGESVWGFISDVEKTGSWKTGRLAAAQKEYAAEMKSSNAETKYAAAINHALTTLAMLSENKLVVDTCKQFGFTLDYGTTSIAGDFDFSKPPATNTLVDNAAKQIQPAVEQALKDLDAIPNTWTGKIKLGDGEYSFDEDVFIDRADVLYMKAALKSALGAVNLIKGYDTQWDWNKFKADFELPEVQETSKVETVPSAPLCEADEYLEAFQVSREGGKIYVRIVGKKDKLSFANCMGYLILDFKNKSNSFSEGSETTDIRIGYGVCKEGVDIWNGYGFETETISYSNTEIVFAIDANELLIEGDEFDYLEEVDFRWSNSDKWEDSFDFYDPIYHSLLYRCFNHQTGLFDKIRNKTSLGKAKTYIADAIKLAKEADALLQKRTSSETFLVNYDSIDEKDLKYLRDNLDSALASLSSTQSFDWHSLDRPQVVADYSFMPNPLRINLAPLFAGKVTRSTVLPPNASGDDNEYVAGFDSFKDPTFGGMLPDITFETLEKLCDVYHLPYRPHGAEGPADPENPVDTDFVLDQNGEEFVVIGGRDIEPIQLSITAASEAQLKLKGLPSGLKFTTKQILNKDKSVRVEANSIYGNAKKAGSYTVSAFITNPADKKSIEQTFSITVKDFAVDAVASNGGTVNGTGRFLVGKKISLKAKAAKGYVFAGWYSDAAYTTPFESALDYRTASLSYIVPECDTVLYAQFVSAAEDSIIELKANSQIVGENPSDTVFTTSGDTLIALDATSVTMPKISVSGLPSGLKFTAKQVLNKDKSILAEANTIYGAASKPGTYIVTAKLTNATIKKAITRSFTIVVDNLTGANDAFKDSLDNARGVKYDIPAGVSAAALDLPSLALKNSGAKLSVKGLPAGLKYNSTTGKIEGVATKAGTYTVMLTVTEGKNRKVSTITIDVAPLPEWAVGTFTGIGEYSGLVQYAEPEDNLYATVTISANGKVSGNLLVDIGDEEKLLTAKLAASSLTGYDAEEGSYYCDVMVAVKDGRNVVEEKIRRLYIIPADYDGANGTQKVGVVRCEDEEVCIGLHQNVMKHKGFGGSLPSFAASKTIVEKTLPIHGDPECEGISTLTLEINSKGAVSATMVDDCIDNGEKVLEKVKGNGELIIWGYDKEHRVYKSSVAIVFGKFATLAVDLDLHISDDGKIYADGCEIVYCTDFADWSM